MKSLAERQLERAQRKSDNAAFSTQTAASGAVGLAAFRVGEAQAAMNVLTDAERDEVRALIENDGFSDSSADADAAAYDAQGNLKSAGIGVVNPLIAPVAAAMAAEGFPLGGDAKGGAPGNGGWGTPPAPAFTPAEGNEAGAHLEGQTGTQGSGDAMLPPVNANMKVADLEAIAAKEGVDLSGASNNADRVDLIEANRKKSA